MKSSVSSTESEKKSPLKAAFMGMICLAVSLGILFSIFAVRYHYFLKGLKNYDKWVKSPVAKDSNFPKLTSREMANLGFAHTPGEHPQTSYINFPYEKKNGVIRIGTFGDSHTQGIEAGFGHDYPSFLQRHFQKAGLDHVEVINFGVKSYGLYQSDLMWKTLGKKYDLDYVIFMLSETHIDRDLMFIEDVGAGVGVHARYILKEDQLELVPVLGENRKEASANYFRMIPLWRYLRYDWRPSPFMNALLPPGREWKSNPFYYRSGVSMQEELLKSYGLLFEQLAKEVKNVIVIAHDDFMDGLTRVISSPNVYVLRSQMTPVINSGIYLAPGSHQSALGNDLQARELFTLLTGKEKPAPPVIQIKESSETGKYDSQITAKPIDHYAKISVELGGYPAGIFTTPKRGGLRIKKEVDLESDKVAGLLFLPRPDLSFLPLHFLVQKDAPVFISFRTDGQLIQFPIGKMDTSSGVISRIVFSSQQRGKGFILKTETGAIKIDSEITTAKIQGWGKPKDVKILIGDKEILIGTKKKNRTTNKREEKVNRFRLRPKENLFYLRANAGQFVPIESVEPDQGPLELVLTHKNGETERIPFFLQYEIMTPETNPFRMKYSNAIPAKKSQ